MMTMKRRMMDLVEHAANDLEVNFCDVMFSDAVEEVVCCLHTNYILNNGTS